MSLPERPGTDLRQAASHTDDPLFSALFMASPLALYTLDGDQRVVFWNPAAERVFGWSSEEAAGLPDPTVPDELRDEACAFAREILGGAPVTQRETTRVRRDGSRVDVSLSGAPVADGAQGAEGIMWIAADITHRRRLEEERSDLLEREQQARLAAQEAEQRALLAVGARERLLAVVSHDLRNSLATVLLNSTAILDTPRPEGIGAFEREQLEWVVRSAEQMNRLISDLLDASTIESGRFRVEATPHQVEPLIREALEMHRPVAAERQIRCTAALDEPLPMAMVDAERIHQVLGNLLGNALKFSPAGSTVEVRASGGDGEVVFAVHDAGPGIPSEHLASIFELYWQAERGRRRSGAGLGLTIARAIVDAHGGRLWVESEPGAGSTFLFSVPATWTDPA